MTDIEIAETRNDWINRLCRPVYVTNEAYGSDPSPFDCLEQAEVVVSNCGYLPDDGLDESEYEFVVMLMNPATGSVAPKEEWEQDYRSMSEEEWGGPDFESGHLIEVVPDGTGWWREA